jgi:hypothetical protein
MDVQALLRRAQGAPELEVPSKPPPAPERPAPAPKVEPKIELAYAPRPRAHAPPPPPTKWRRLAVAGGVIALAVLLAVFALPLYAKHVAVSTARDLGLAMSVEHASVSLGSVELGGITLTSADVPSVKIACKEVRVTSTFSPQSIHLRGVEVKIDGAVADVAAQIDAWRARRTAPAQPARAGAARKVTVTGARVVWTRPFGEGYELELSELGLDLGPNGALGDDLKLDARRVTLVSPRGRLGPWGLAVERDAKATRSRLELDPVVPDGPHALLVTSAALPPRLTVKVTRSPLARLGVPPDAIGLASPPEVELEVDGTVGGGKVDASFALALYRARLGGAPNAVDLKLKGALSGDPARPMDVQKGELVVGPFQARATGTVTPLDGGYRLDLAWKAAPIPCDVLARKVAQGPAQLGLEIAQALGIAAVVGTANASGLLAIDTRALDKASLSMITNDTCGLAIFPNK